MNLGLSFWSKVSLIGYLTFIILNEYWTTVSIFGATEKFLDSGPITATVLIFFIFLGLRILLICYIRGDRKWFNLKYIPTFCRRSEKNTDDSDWAQGNIVEKVVNVISNLVAVTPFSVYRNPVEVLEKIEKQMECSEEKNRIRREILLMWWQNPIKKLSKTSVRFIKRELAKKEINEEENKIKDILTDLLGEEKLNSPLINTVQLNRDFAGLFILVLLKNACSFIIELAIREEVITEVHIEIGSVAGGWGSGAMFQ